MTTQKVDSVTIVKAKEYHFHSHVQNTVTATAEGDITLAKYSAHGVTISVNPIRHETKFTLSSKILGKDYLEMISKESIDKVQRSLAKFIDITIDELLDSTVCKVDATTDIRVGDKEAVITVLYALAALQAKYRRSPRLYKSGGLPTSFWLKRDNNDHENIDYLSVYNKLAELINKGKKGNWAFLETLSVADRERIMQEASDTVRVETKLSSRRMIRKHYDLPDKHVPLLRDILYTEVNVNRNMVESIYSQLVKPEAKSPDFKSITDLGYYLALEKNDFCLERSFHYLQQAANITNKARAKKRLASIIVAMDMDMHRRQRQTYIDVISLLQ